MTFPRTLSLHQGHPHDRKGEVEIGLHAVLIPQEEVTAVDVEMLACQWTATCQSILCWIDRGAQIPTTASTWGAWMRVPSSPPTTPAQTPLGTTAPDEDKICVRSTHRSVALLPLSVALHGPWGLGLTCLGCLRMHPYQAGLGAWIGSLTCLHSCPLTISWP